MHSCRLQAESMSWESLLNKHRSKADELDKWALLHKHTAHMDSRRLLGFILFEVLVSCTSLSRCRCVERGEEKGVPLDPSCFAKSSQSQLILNKPDYKAVLTGQQTTPKHGASGETMMLYSSGLKCIFIFYIQTENAIDISQASSSASIVTSLLTNTFIFAVNVDICY